MDKGGKKGEWIYGFNPVAEAVKSGRKIDMLYLYRQRRDQDVEELVARACARGIKIRYEDRDFFDGRFHKGHQGIAAFAAPRRYLDLDELLGIPELKNEPPFFLVLDCIEDPRNFGAILRVAESGGVHGVVIQSHRSAMMGPEAVKASAGAAEYVPVSVVSNVKHAMKKMKDMGISVFGAEAGGVCSLYEADMSGPLALVVGSEGRGLRRTVREGCDFLVSIPMKGVVNSLNASVAAGVLVFEVVRRRFVC